MNLFENLQLMQESETNTYKYVGPVYHFEQLIDTIKEPIYTTAANEKDALNKINYKLKIKYGYDPKRAKLTLDSKGLELIEKPEDFEEISHEPVINDPKYNYDDPDREGNYIVESILSFEEWLDKNFNELITDYAEMNNISETDAYDDENFEEYANVAYDEYSRNHTELWNDENEELSEKISKFSFKDDDIKFNKGDWVVVNTQPRLNNYVTLIPVMVSREVNGPTFYGRAHNVHEHEYSTRGAVVYKCNSEEECNEFIENHKGITTLELKSIIREDIEDFEPEDTNQKYTSANTSINSSKLPAIFKLVHFDKGTVNLDFGGGRFDNVAEYLAKDDVINLVYDPYNRSSEHNTNVLKEIRKNGGADTVTCSNVLNVIAEPEARQTVIKNIYNLAKSGAKVYFTVYEGSGSGEGAETKSGYQLNKKTADYLDEIKEVFPNAVRKGKLISATK